jgi:predicted transcriptional regulator
MSTTKEQVIRAIEELPDDVSLEQIQEHFRFLAAVREGLEAIDRGEVVDHEDVPVMIQKWFA